jgi:pimeloyl-ACP methyl ester carboxylesterase
VEVTESDLDLDLDGGGGALHVYDTGPGELAVLWHHGTPNIGTPPAPLFAASERLGIRWVAYDRPGYGGSTPVPGGRPLSTAAAYGAAVADALGIERFAVMGHSGGSTHALACAALLPDRVLAAVSMCGLAPYGADGLDWFAGMADSGVASLRAALAGRAAKEAHEATDEERDMGFTPADYATFEGPWGWFGSVVGPALAGGKGGLIDDDLAYVAPWNCDPADIAAPTLLLHGEEDRVVPATHSRWLAAHIPAAELRLHPADSHISIVNHAEEALTWLRTRTP